MKNKAFLLLALLLLIVLSGCESGAKINFVNRSSFPIYVTIEDTPMLAIPGNSSRSVDIETDTQSLLTGTVNKEVLVYLKGETYQIYDQDLHAYQDSTIVTVQAGKTLSIYTDPNRASIKIVNNSDRVITSAEIYRHNFVSPLRIGALTDIQPGEMRFTHVNYSIPINSSVQPWVPTPATRYYYYVVLIDSEGEQYVFGDETNILYNDQQYLINFAPGMNGK